MMLTAAALKLSWKKLNKKLKDNNNNNNNSSNNSNSNSNSNDAINMTSSSSSSSSSIIITPSNNNNKKYYYAIVIFWYIIFGILHELSHYIVGRYYFVLLDNINTSSSPQQNLHETLLDILFHRNVKFNILLLSKEEEESEEETEQEYYQYNNNIDNINNINNSINIIRHSGWIFSLLLFLFLKMMNSKSKTTTATATATATPTTTTTTTATRKEYDLNYYYDSNFLPLLQYVAFIVMLESISTDLLQLPVIFPFFGSVAESSSTTSSSSSSSTTTTFFCGNFGVILLHHMWLSNRSSNALDCLQKMVEVTMMRGAQSGGTVTFSPSSSSSSSFSNSKKSSKSKSKSRSNEGNGDDDGICGNLLGTRSRVVNKKRTDLSVSIRNKLQNGMNKVSTNNNVPKDYVTAIVGHTRFATSSKATLDGTHPHRWTPATYYQVYNDFSSTTTTTTTTTNDNNKNNNNNTSSPIIKPKPVSVENYITHNGDFDFYTVNQKTYDLEAVQQWLVHVTSNPMPASVDSCAIAGMIDIIRTQGCFVLSLRYAVSLCLPTSQIFSEMPIGLTFPSNLELELLSNVFDEILQGLLLSSEEEEDNNITCLDDIGSSVENRQLFVSRVLQQLEKLHRANLVLARVDSKNNHKSILEPFEPFLQAQLQPEYDGTTAAAAAAATNNTAADDIIMMDPETGYTSNLAILVKETIDAFFDNDLFHTTKIFLKNAKGSFGLCVTSSLDAHRQVCMAARGQTISIAFYPKKGLICYGSEQAAVKAGLDAELPGADKAGLGTSRHDLDIDALRLDLDDLGGEIIVLDWGGKKYKKTPPVSVPNRHLTEYKLMNGAVTAILYQESKSSKQDSQLYHRMTRLTRNGFIKPLEEEPEDHDLVKADIQDIPKICQNIQDEWHSARAATSLNRLTAFNLSRCLRKRLDAHVAGTVPPLAVDILVTGCEVSLWVGEQFASDLRKAFPMLRIQAVSSNKLLGLYGQEIAVPAIGFQYSPETYDLNDAIVIIVSHSGGTFAPLACSNLLQSATKDIFVVTSEWDTQIGKQLRGIDEAMPGENSATSLFNSRIFTTDVGIRPAEPCSLSVAATHQLLTNLFEYICVVILSDEKFRRVTKARITEQDLRTLERCNRMNIDALSEIVGFTASLYPFDELPRSCRELKEAGDLWAEHVLENAKAYIMSFVYIFVTVTTGWPLVSAIAYGIGLKNLESDWYYLIRFIDSAIYFWLPQINITILRLWQGRNLLHRMVGRTVAIGDIPWVAQSAEAFLSKIFACSYSIAGVSVLSGNPADHFVHRHTHRVTRGTLLVCGRPDGRLSKLSTAEASVCLSVNQASSIQSWGGTCESITIGHNPFKLPLSHRGIFLKRKRPMFLCERMLIESDKKDEKERSMRSMSELSRSTLGEDGASEDMGCNLFRCCFDILKGLIGCICTCLFQICCGCFRRDRTMNMDSSFFRAVDSSIKLENNRFRSAAALFGAYMNMQDAGTNNKKSEVQNLQEEGEVTVDEVVEEAIQDRKWEEKTRKLFQAINLDGSDDLGLKEFIEGAKKLNDSLSEAEATTFFYRTADKNTKRMTYEQFVTLMRSPDFTGKVKAPPSHKNERGIIQIEASDERYFGATMRKLNRAEKTGVQDDLDFILAKTQRFSQELYETRIASLQRFVSMTVMFHQMGRRVEQFFEKISCGWWGYRMDRTHSIMRIATTASPVSGADVRHRMQHIRLANKVRHSVNVISAAYLAYLERKNGNKVAPAVETSRLGAAILINESDDSRRQIQGEDDKKVEVGMEKPLQAKMKNGTT